MNNIDEYYDAVQNTSDKKLKLAHTEYLESDDNLYDTKDRFTKAKLHFFAVLNDTDDKRITALDYWKNRELEKE